MESNKGKIKKRRWGEMGRRIPEETNAKWDISKIGWKLLFMAEIKSNTKKDCLGDDYSGTNGWNKSMDSFKRTC